jgi:hypothetical protein
VVAGNDVGPLHAREARKRLANVIHSAFIKRESALQVAGVQWLHHDVVGTGADRRDYRSRRHQRAREQDT